MANLNLDLGYFTDVRVKRLVARLGERADVLPLRLLSHCGLHHPMVGKLAGYTASDVETIVGWNGPAGQCVDVFLELQFLKQTAHGFAVPDWANQQGHLKAFHVRAKKAAKARWKGYEGGERGNAASNAPSIASRSRKQCPKPTIPSPSNDTEPTQTKPPVSPTADVVDEGDAMEGDGMEREEMEEHASDPAQRTELRRELKRIGVSGAAVERLAGIDGLTAAVVREMYFAAQQSGKSDPVAFVVDRLNKRKFYRDGIPPKRFKEMVNAGHVTHIDGVAVDGYRIGFNDAHRQGVYLFDGAGNEIAAARGEMIAATEFQLSDELPPVSVVD